MKKKLFTTTALVCCFMICLAAAVADLTGKWTGIVKTPDGNEVTLTYDFKVDGDKLQVLANQTGTPLILTRENLKEMILPLKLLPPKAT